MASSKVIRIDHEVWAELQLRAVPFQDNPNSVLRRAFGLRPARTGQSDGSETDELDTRVAKLFHLVQERIDYPVLPSITTNGRSCRFKSQSTRVVAFIYSQIRRLKVATSEQIATNAGIKTWDHWLKNGWWNQDNSVYWHILNDDDDAYVQVADVLDRLWRH